ncbi:MAG: arginine--tRNA ligase [Patescibacteria group bacterium]
MKDNIKNIILDAFKNLQEKGVFSLFKIPDFEIEHPEDFSFGDYSANIAMKSSKISNDNPRSIAEKIKKEILEIDKGEKFKQIEVAGSGFLNFYLKSEFFSDSLNNIIKSGNDWGRGNILSGQRYLIEHSSPNLFKPFHIGHLVNNIVGESISRILAFAGASVTVVVFPSDVSPGIAKAVWGIINKGWQDSITIEKIGQAYVYGVERYENDDEVKKEVDKINNIIYNKFPCNVFNIYIKGRDISIDYFKSIMIHLDSKFDDIIFESEAEEVGKKIVRENTPAIFEESNGAIIFKGSKYGLFDNVFINSAGFATYLGKDIGLLKIKSQRFSFDKSLTITDIEQKQHFELVKKASELIDDGKENKSYYLQHGRLRFASGKASSRVGNVPLVSDLLGSIKEYIVNRFVDIDKNGPMAEQIALGALKYSIARVSAGSNIVFDFNKSVAVEGDTGPYLQYTHTRCTSLLFKAPKATIDYKVMSDYGITRIDRLLYRFPEVVLRSAENYDQHYVAIYLFSLASEFNSWYAKEKILDGGDNQSHKLAIVKAVKITIKNGLNLLGIEAPERM